MVKQTDIGLPIVALFAMAAIIATDMRSIVYAIITARYWPLLYLGLSLVSAQLLMYGLKNVKFRMGLTSILNIFFIITVFLDNLSPVFQYVRICLFLMISLTFQLNKRYEFCFLIVFLGFSSSIIGKTNDIVYFLGIDPILVAEVCALAIVSIISIIRAIKQKFSQIESSNARELLHNLSISIIFIVFVSCLTVITSLSNEFTTNSLLCYLLLAGILLNGYFIHKVDIKNGMKKSIALLLIDILGSYLVTNLLGLFEISFLYMVLCALIWIIAAQFAAGEYNLRAHGGFNRP